MSKTIKDWTSITVELESNREIAVRYQVCGIVDKDTGEDKSVLKVVRDDADLEHDLGQIELSKTLSLNEGTYETAIRQYLSQLFDNNSRI